MCRRKGNTHVFGALAYSLPHPTAALQGFIADDAHTTSLYVGRRVWRIYDWLAPSQKVDPYVGWHPSVETYPFSMKVKLCVSQASALHAVRVHGDYLIWDFMHIWL